MEDPALDHLHQIEFGADDLRILAQKIGPRHRHVGILQGSDRLEFPVDRMGGRQKLARRFLPKHVFLPAREQQKGRVTLPNRELADLQIRTEAGHLLFQIGRQTRLVETMRRQYLGGLDLAFVRHYINFSTIDQASSATGRARLPCSTACSLAAVPSSARLAMPCRIAARRNML